jgi:hypothetical protein
MSSGAHDSKLGRHVNDGVVQWMNGWREVFMNNRKAKEGRVGRVFSGV